MSSLTSMLFAVLMAASLTAGCRLVPCGGPTLGPNATAPLWAVRINELPMGEDAPIMIPGIDRADDPQGLNAYAAVVLYDEMGMVLNERWLDTFTTWDGSGATFAVASVWPRPMPPGRLTLLLADGLRPATSWDTSSGAFVGEELPHSEVPETGGQLASWVELPDDTQLATRLPTETGGTETGVGNDLVQLDPDDTTIVQTFVLDSISPSGGDVLVGSIAALGDGRVVIGTWLPDDPGGAVAVLEPDGMDLQRVDQPFFTGCSEVVPMPPGSSPDSRRVAVLCAGDLTVEADARRDAGLMLLEAIADGPVEIIAEREASTLGTGMQPIRSIVGLAGDWVAVVERGVLNGLPDRLLAVDMSGDAVAGEGVIVLYEELHTDQFGPGLGEGDFALAADPMMGPLGELWWASVGDGLVRWSLRSAGTTPDFVSLAAVPVPECALLPARVVRHLPPASTP